MSTSIDKYSSISPVILAALEKAGMANLKIGDILLMNERGSHSHANDVHEIVGFEDSKKYKTIYVQYRIATNWEATEWGEQIQTTSISEYKNYYYNHSIKIPPGRTVQECWDEAVNVLDGKADIKAYQDRTTDNLNANTALIHKNSKAGLEAIKNSLEEKRSRVELVHAFISYEMERRRQALDKVRREMYEVLATFEKKIKRVMRVITSIELYLGIEEELFQIQQGPTATANTTINFRQQVLYMDEEIGHWKDGGLDFKDIKWFDEWLLKNDNFKKLAPEERCVVVFRPRRNEKFYVEEWYENNILNRPNWATYLLIRNGENLYRIYTEKINIYPRLFPKRAELEEILKQIDEEKWESRKEDAKEKAEDLTYQYQQRAMLLQGLIDRTEVFNPLPGGRVSIFNMDATPGSVNFIYDDEATLPTGRLSFWNWMKQLNSTIGEGSRVLITGVYDSHRGYYSRKDFNDRFYNNANEYNIPDPPNEGIYTVEEFHATSILKTRKGDWEDLVEKYPNFIQKDTRNRQDRSFKLLKVKPKYWRYDANGCQSAGDRDAYFIQFTNAQGDLTIKYNPGGQAKRGWNDYQDRKNKVRFLIEKDDTFILNYDQLSLKDVEFYLTSRVDRPNYLSMMPVLEKVRAFRLKELATEKEFIRFIADRNPISGLTPEEVRKRVIKAVVWWKYKNKWKRPITKDDTLALRMIEKTINTIKQTKQK